MARELGIFAQCHKATNTPGSNTVFFLDHDTIKNIPMDRKITYAHIMVDYSPKTWLKHLIKYLHEAPLCTAKPCQHQNTLEQCWKDLHAKYVCDDVNGVL